jgi:protein-S-isoprenylcysteine O-methyltransferase Ste14
VIASEFEYRHRFVIIALVFAFAYSFYNLDHLNIVYAIVPRNSGVLGQDVLARFVYGVSALLAGIGAAILTWASAYRPSSPTDDQPQAVALPVGGPYRYVRNPHYIGYFLLVVALGSFQSRWGFPILIAAETFLFLRLIAREEMQLEHRCGERFQEYCRLVPRLLPSLRPQIAAGGQLPHWRQAFGNQAVQWGFVATLVAFACTLSDPVGYMFACATLLLLVLQKLVQVLSIRIRRT